MIPTVDTLSDKDCGVSKPSTRRQARSIILVDMHMLVRLALYRVVATLPQTHITLSLGTIQDVLAARIVVGRHVIVLGPSTSIADCLLLIQQMRERQALCSVILIQHGLHPGAIRLLVEQGVHGVLDESASEQDLAQAIQTASLGKRFLSGSVQDSLMQPIDHLTEREIQVLSRLKYGESNFRIASVLGLKEKTIEKYLTTIYQKLHVHSRMEAILYLQKMHF